MPPSGTKDYEVIRENAVSCGHKALGACLLKKDTNCPPSGVVERVVAHHSAIHSHEVDCRCGTDDDAPLHRNVACFGVGLALLEGGAEKLKTCTSANLDSACPSVLKSATTHDDGGTAPLHLYSDTLVILKAQKAILNHALVTPDHINPLPTVAPSLNGARGRG